MSAAAFALLVSTTAATLGVPVQVAVQNAPGAPYSLDLERSTTDAYAISKVEPTKLELLPLAVGALPIRLFWKVEGEKEPVASPPLVLQVAEPPMASPELADIKPPLRARPALWPWLLALLAASAAYWYWLRRAKASSVEEALAAAQDRRPAHERALEALAALETLWQEGRRREFYFALTDVAREYLERRFEIPATRQTTAELLKALTPLALERSLLLRLRALFERADLVKFADVAPEPAWGPADLELARGVVRETAPPPPAPAPQEAGR